MTQDYFSRISNLIRGAALSFVKDLERANPEIVLEGAIEAQQERIARTAMLINRLASYRAQLQREEAQLLQEVQRLEREAARLVHQDEEEALLRLEHKHAFLERIEEIRSTVAETTEKIAKAKRKQDRDQQDLERLKRERQRIQEERALARTKQAKDDLLDVSPNAADMALLHLRERLDGRKKQRGSTSKVHERRRRKAEADLAALRKAAGIEAEPHAAAGNLDARPGAEGSGNDNARPPSDPMHPDLPKRRL